MNPSGVRASEPLPSAVNTASYPHCSDRTTRARAGTVETPQIGLAQVEPMELVVSHARRSVATRFLKSARRQRFLGLGDRAQPESLTVGCCPAVSLLGHRRPWLAASR